MHGKNCGNDADKAKRAVQFAAFDALCGYSELTDNEDEKIKNQKRYELSEYQEARLSYKLSIIEKGAKVMIVHYEKGRYGKANGRVTSIDKVMRKLTIDKKEYEFDDIYLIKITGSEHE